MSKRDVLQQNLQAILENRQKQGWLLEPPAPGNLAGMADFSSNDSLSLSSSGLLGKEFLGELERHPDFILGARASRWGEGSTDYLSQLEEHIARFHNAESALFFNCGFEANVAIYSTVPQPDDVVLYDSLIHASVREGLRRGHATALSFAHNDVASLRQRLQAIKGQHTGSKSGQALVFIALESYYSMDGDVSPLEAMVKAVKQQLPLGNAAFIIDEAHSTGLVGPHGSGLVSHLGLEKEFSIRLHTFGKAHGASGAVVLASPECKRVLLSCVRGLIFSTAPTFITLAAVKAGYILLASDEGERRRALLQSNINLFFEALTSHTAWPDCQRLGIITIPMKAAPDTPKSSIIPIIAQSGEALALGDFLKNKKFRVIVVHFPVVPKDKERVRINLHSDHTPEQILSLVRLILEWVQTRSNVGRHISHL
ncbi:hypothetical protein FSARC_8522 [Fusarium sarcochroum]|uniref:Aminotransferase class I/classII large domain-containing protein n=1 Tax=Fusarium sarcochroum TaxID=1208366 RepID=A0A8H4TT23_9HYPO|nr:hypothetical protein FSARC_8522 [Fusarium sarcochroum]